MKIHAYQLNSSKILLPTVQLEQTKSIEQLQKYMNSGLVRVVLVPEAVGESVLEHLKTLSEDMDPVDVIIVAAKVKIATTRDWTSRGAADVWDLNHWEDKLNQFVSAIEASNVLPMNPMIHSDETKVIAVASAYSGAGATFTSLLIATYLKKHHKARVAIWEAVPSGKERYRKLHYLMGMAYKNVSDVRFEMNGISFFESGVDDQMIEQLQAKYDYIIYDMGQLTDSKNDHLFFRAHVPILVGSGSLLRMDTLVETLKAYSHRQSHRLQILLTSCDHKTMKLAREVMPGRMVLSMPTHEKGLFELQDSSNEVIEGLLSTLIQPKAKKGLLGLLR